MTQEEYNEYFTIFRGVGNYYKLATGQAVKANQPIEIGEKTKLFEENMMRIVKEESQKGYLKNNQVKSIVNDCWQFFRTHLEVNDSDEWWTDTILDATDICKDHKRTRFCDLLIMEVLEEFARIQKRK